MAKKKKSTIQRLASSTASRLEALEGLESQVREAQQQASQAPAIPADLVRDPRTGLSQAQVEAQQALQEAQQARTELGLAGVLTTPAGSAGRIDTPPATGLKAGYEWYQVPKPGGGTEWRQRPTRDTLVKSYTTLFSGGPTGPGSGGGGGGGGGNDVAALLAAQAARDKLAADQAAAAAAEEKRRAGQSAYNLLFEQFNQYGLGALVQPLQDLIVQGLSAAEFTLKLRDTDAYKKRFAANQQRINRGLRALSEAEYIGLEDQYQNVMRNYGLPANYYTRGDMGRQEGFERFIAGDVSAAELEDRIQTAQNRVINAAPEVSRALREFYPGITNGDILAYALDPDKALTDIRRKVTAAEIGAGAMQAGLATGLARAEELGRFGVTGEQARQGFATIAEFLPTAQKLGDIYRKQGLGDFTQATAEQEVFGITGAAEAATKRKRLTQLEQAAFSGQTGVAGGALARDRAGSF